MHWLCGVDNIIKLRLKIEMECKTPVKVKNELGTSPTLALLVDRI